MSNFNEVLSMIVHDDCKARLTIEQKEDVIISTPIKKRAEKVVLRPEDIKRAPDEVLRAVRKYYGTKRNWDHVNALNELTKEEEFTNPNAFFTESGDVRDLRDGSNMGGVTDNANPWDHGDFSDYGTYDMTDICDENKKKNKKVPEWLAIKKFRVFANKYVKRYSGFKMPTAVEFLKDLASVEIPDKARFIYGPAPKGRSGITLKDGAWFYDLKSEKVLPESTKRVMRKYVILVLFNRIMKNFSKEDKEFIMECMFSDRTSGMIRTLKYWMVNVFGVKLGTFNDLGCDNEEDALYKNFDKDRMVFSVDKPIKRDGDTTVTFKDIMETPDGDDVYTCPGFCDEDLTESIDVKEELVRNWGIKEYKDGYKVVRNNGMTLTFEEACSLQTLYNG